MKIENTEIRILQGDIFAVKADWIAPPLPAGPGERSVRDHFRGLLKEADEKGAGSVAFPVRDCGGGKIPAGGTARIMTQELLRYLRWGKTKLQEVVFCLPNAEASEAFEGTVRGYVDHIQDTLGKGPYVTVDAIIEVDAGLAGGPGAPEGIILIERSNPPYGWALPGGFVDYEESLEAAVAREVKEETGVDFIDFRQFHTYSDPDRDPRFHTISTVFVGKGRGHPKSGSDAKRLEVVPCGELVNLDYAFDHKKILRDYLNTRMAKG